MHGFIWVSINKFYYLNLHCLLQENIEFLRKAVLSELYLFLSPIFISSLKFFMNVIIKNNIIINGFVTMSHYLNLPAAL
jgi:hypothetical protein